MRNHTIFDIVAQQLRPPLLSSSSIAAAMAAITTPTPSSLSITRRIKPPAFQFNYCTTAACISSPIRSQFCPKTQNPSFSTLAPIRSSTAAADLSASELDAAKQQSIKSRLRNGDTLYGLFLCSSSPLLAEIAGLAGYDFVVVDMEHGYGGISDALPCLRALAATRTPAILRLPESTAAWAKKALDLGPQGIMFPMIETPESAKSAVSYCRYPPKGVRGAAHPIVRASGYGIDAGGYLESYEEELLIMCQVESINAVENIEEIAAVEGVDCIQMGPMDLSASMGYLWDPGNKKVKEVLRTIERTVLKTSPQSGKDTAGRSHRDEERTMATRELTTAAALTGPPPDLDSTAFAGSRTVHPMTGFCCPCFVHIRIDIVHYVPRKRSCTRCACDGFQKDEELYFSPQRRSIEGGRRNHVIEFGCSVA